MNTNIGEVKKMRVIHKSGVKIFITITFNKGSLSKPWNNGTVRLVVRVSPRICAFCLFP